MGRPLKENVRNGGIHYVGERVVPDETPFYLFQEHSSRYIFATEYTKGKNVLDLGCGVGDGAAHLIKKGAASVVGGDVSRNALSFSMKLCIQEDFHPVCLSADSLPFCSKQFDVIVAFEVIEHVYRYKDLLEECHRVLKKGGLLLLSTPNKRIDLIWRSKPQGAFHVHEFFPEEIVRLILKHGFEIIAVFGQSPTTLYMRLILSLFGLFSKLCVSVYNGFSIREQFVKILRKGFNVSKSGTEISGKRVDEYSILPFTEECSYIIIVGKKP
jgi:2-polyprenyl-3-methyl-5-hydroxy-6-metoxy-1,4-benzoquinol methylase